jgi:hypothetical protein
MPNYCILPANGECGCSISGVCYNKEAQNSSNICKKASNSDLNCTGQWENGPDRKENCVGATACFKNQNCTIGRCLSEPYALPEFCRASYACNGNNDRYDYTMMTGITVI